MNAYDKQPGKHYSNELIEKSEWELVPSAEILNFEWLKNCDCNSPLLKKM